MKTNHLAFLYALVVLCLALVIYQYLTPEEGTIEPPARQQQEVVVANGQSGHTAGQQVALVDHSGRIERLEKRVAELTGVLDRLAVRLEERTSRPRENSPSAPVAPRPTAAPADAALADDVGKLRAQLGGLAEEVAKLGQLPTLDSKAGRNRIESVVQDEITKFVEQRRDRRRSMQEMISDEIVNEFAARARLSDEQLAGLYPHLGQLREAERNSWRAIRRGEMDIPEARQAMADARARMDEEARKVLDDEQYKAYEEEIKKHFHGPMGLFKQDK